MIFEIHAERSAGDTKVFYYDNMENILKDAEGNVFEFPDKPKIPDQYLKEYTSFDKDHPLKKSNKIRILKIQMGLSCNYSCDYCSQKFVCLGIITRNNVHDA
jgi:uncharacterized protein